MRLGIPTGLELGEELSSWEARTRFDGPPGTVLPLVAAFLAFARAFLLVFLLAEEDGGSKLDSGSSVAGASKAAVGGMIGTIGDGEGGLTLGVVGFWKLGCRPQTSTASFMSACVCPGDDGGSVMTGIGPVRQP